MRDISHTTDINAPIDDVWAELINISDWEWNKWTRLEAEGTPREGMPGELKASYDGGGEWKTFRITFGEVNDEDHVLAWSGKVGPKGCIFSGRHTMRLRPLNEYTTRLYHEERFFGVLPALGLGLPYKTLDRNYLLMNVGLKAHVEAKIGRNSNVKKVAAPKLGDLFFSHTPVHPLIFSRNALAPHEPLRQPQKMFA